MSPYEVLILCHFVADWLFQTKKQAYGKLTDWKIRLWHSITYCCITLILFVLFTATHEIPLLTCILVSYYITFTHFIFDTPQVKLWWCKHIKREDNPPEWLLIAIDQISHFISLVPVVFWMR